jgi:hypothetical protein
MTIKALYPSIEPSLNLDFANTKRLDPRITFTRASTGTYVGESGLIQSAAVNEARFDHNPATGESLGLLVEEARTNSATYSNDLINGSWGGFNLSQFAPNIILAPDNTQTAAFISASSVASYHYLSRNITVSAGATVTISMYLKQGGYQYGYVYSDAAAKGTIFDLSNGTAVGNILAAPTSSSIQAYGNGWYRCSITVTVPSTATVIWVGPSNSSSSGSFAGDGTSGIYVWGAQVEVGTFPTSYIPTPATFSSRTSTATFYDSAGTVQTAASGVARSNAFFPDSNGVMRSAGLLLEAAGTNLVTYSEQFDNAAWSKTLSANTSTISANSAVAPDGTSTADKIVTTVNNGIHGVDRSPAITVTSGTTYTISVYAKAAGWSRIGIRAGASALNLRCTVDLSTGAIINNTAGIASVKFLPNSWYHISITGIATSTSFSVIFEAHNTTSVQSSETGDGTSGIFVWGAQLEASPYATSYIPTVASAVTRSADVSTSATVTRSADVASITGTNFSGWYNQNAGTVLSVVKNVPFYGGFWYFGPTGAPRWWTRYELGNGVRTQAYDGSGGSGAVEIVVPGASTSSILPVVRHAVAIDNINQEHAGSANNSSVVVGSWDTILGVSSLQLGIRADAVAYLNGTISRFTYWPVRLSNVQLQAITAS